MSVTTPTQFLAEAGVSIWLDDLSRESLDNGSLATLIRDANVTGVTTNPTIFHTAISTGSAYNHRLAALGRTGAGPEEALLELTTHDVAAACDLFADTFEQTGGMDGRVSIEVDPRLARSTDATIEQARLLADAVARPNVLIKIPATPEGLPAIQATIAAGISVNVTLIFSLDRYQEVIRAYKNGLEKAQEAGLDLSRIHSVASFFISRVDVEVDRQLDLLDAPDLKGRAGIANAALAYEAYRQHFSHQEWVPLANAGANPQRPLWASTGVKNPAYADTMYVTRLIAPGTVNTMPLSTLEAIRDHGKITPNSLRQELASARAVFTDLEKAGVPFDDIVGRLEVDGVEKFAGSWDLLLNDVARRLR